MFFELLSKNDEKFLAILVIIYKIKNRFETGLKPVLNLISLIFSSKELPISDGIFL